jgi:GPH family glycoside/pentoside/hexuronide:cation symporter
MSAASLLSMPLSFIFLAIAPKMAKKFGLEGYIRHGLMIGAVMYVALFAMHLVMPVSAIVHLIISSVAGAFVMISTQQQYGLVGESIDYNEYLTGKRTEGSIYGTFSLSRRVGTTIGNSLGVLMLGWIGYDANLAVQTASTLTGIKVLCVLLPGIFALGSWVAFRFVWNITPAVREKMRAAAEAKKVSAE